MTELVEKATHKKRKVIRGIWVQAPQGRSGKEQVRSQLQSGLFLDDTGIRPPHLPSFYCTREPSIK